MESLQNRHDLTDAQWEKIEPLINKRLENWGSVNANDNRVFVNWEFILAELIEEPDYKWLMIDASHCKVHPHAA